MSCNFLNNIHNRKDHDLSVESKFHQWFFHSVQHLLAVSLDELSLPHKVWCIHSHLTCKANILSYFWFLWCLRWKQYVQKLLFPNCFARKGWSDVGTVPRNKVRSYEHKKEKQFLTAKVAVQQSTMSVCLSVCLFVCLSQKLKFIC